MTQRTHSFSTHRWIFLAITLLVGGLVAVASQAQPRGHGKGFGHGGGHGHGPGHGPMLLGADANDDGAIDTSELDAFLTSIDADADGVLAYDEMIAQHQARAAEAGIERPEPGRHAGRMYEHVLERLDTNDDDLLQTTEVEAHFAELDADSDGILTSDEFPLHGRRGERMHRAAIGMALKAADVDEDRNVTTSEWNAFLATVDSDGDGQVSFDEVRRSADPAFEPPSVSIDQANELFDSLDADGDGVVSEDELPQRRGPHGRRGGPRGPQGARGGSF